MSRGSRHNPIGNRSFLCGLAAKAACSAEDKETLVPMVKQLRDLGDLACRKGLLALEGELPQITDPFLKLGMQLIVDKTDPDNVRDILDSDIYYNESNGRELLKKIIIREGLLRIQAGDNARNILICARVFLGKLKQNGWCQGGGNARCLKREQPMQQSNRQVLREHD